MSSGRDPPLVAGQSQQSRNGSGYLITPKSAFHRPAPPRDTSEQQISQQSTSHSRLTTEPIRTGLVTSSAPPTYTGPKTNRYSGVSFKSTTPTPSSSTSKSIPAHTQDLSQVSVIYIFFFTFVPQ